MCRLISPRLAIKPHPREKEKKKAHRIPLHTPIHHPRGKGSVGPDVDVQAVGLVAAASFVGGYVCLAVVLRVARGTGVDYLHDDSAVDLGAGVGAVGADVVDAVAGAAADCAGGAGGRDIVGGWILAAVCGAERVFLSDGRWMKIGCWGERESVMLAAG